MDSSPQGGGLMDAGGRETASAGLVDVGATLCISWHPRQPLVSPGMTPLIDRMVCNARYFSSSNWK
jgi:hypothetical protein